MTISAVSDRWQPFIQKTDHGLNRLVLMVDGVHCSGCISRIESTLKRDPHVHAARLNFSTRRLNLEWHGAADLVSAWIAAIQKMGYTVHAAQDGKPDAAVENEQKLLFALGVAGFASGNIMLVSFALWITDTQTMGVAMRDFLHLISALIALPAVIVAGRPFFISAYRALSHVQTNMDVPISVGLILTCGISLFELFRHGNHAYFDSAVMLMFFLLIGRYLDARVRARARGAASDLMNMMKGTAQILESGTVRSIAIENIVPGMMVQVAMGERIPADGIVTEGKSQIDMSVATGESDPVVVMPGSSVMSGTLNLDAPLILRAEKPATGSFLADIIHLMELAEQGQARYVRLADRAARLYTPVVHVLALAAFIGWTMIGHMPWPDALMIAATVLIITCPCALGLAVPVVQVLATGQLMRRGILVKAGDALERLAQIDTVMFDKTGTLTAGHPALIKDTGYTPDDLRLAASIAVQSRHPISQALVAAYDGPIDPMTPEEHPGKGLSVTTEAGDIRLGASSWCGVQEFFDDAQNTSETWLSRPGQNPVRFIFHDPLRLDARDVIQDLTSHHLRIGMLSGDRAARVMQMVDELGLDPKNVAAAQSPADKFSRIKAEKESGHRVLMVGDGLNDAPVLGLANVSMSPASAIHVAQNAADIVFTGERLGAVATAYRTAVFATRLVKQNFILAIVYNALAIPLAIAGYVTPMIAALAMSGSSLVVIANSYRLRRVR